MPAATKASEIARFLIDEHKPSIRGNLQNMTDEEIGLSIIQAVSLRFSGWSQDDLLLAMMEAQEVENAGDGSVRERSPS